MPTSNQVALVTGAIAGIGNAFVRALGARGAHLVPLRLVEWFSRGRMRRRHR